MSQQAENQPRIAQLWVLILLLWTSTSCVDSPFSAQGNTAQVTRIIDGDTIEVQTATGIERVRYIGIDTPERGQPGYRAATEANRTLVEGQRVILVRDSSDRDRNDRLLRYLFLNDGRLVNGELVAQGWAQPVAYEPDTARQDEFERLAVAAAQARRGFWSGTSAYDGAMSYGFTQGEAILREGPSSNFPRTAVIPIHTPLTIFGRTPPSDWLQVRLPDRTGGWVSARQVWVNVDPTTIPVAGQIPQLAPRTDEANVVIVTVDKRAEFVDLQNNGENAVDLAGWVLRSERGMQDCPLSGLIQPGELLRVWSQTGVDGLSCEFANPIWSNSEPDPAVLLNPQGQAVSRSSE